MCALRVNAQTALDDKALPVCDNLTKFSVLLLKSASVSHQIPCDPLPAGGTQGQDHCLSLREETRVAYGAAIIHKSCKFAKNVGFFF